MTKRIESIEDNHIELGGIYWCNHCILLPSLDNILVDQYILLLFSDDILIDQYILLRLTDYILFEQYILLPTGQMYWLLRLRDDILFGVLDHLFW